MAKQYVQYTRKSFEFQLKGILIKNKLGYMADITDEWKNEGKETWERVYAISTRNKSVRIIVFSSVDIELDKVRTIGSDAVKIVEEWNTKNGKVYKKIAHHYRLNTLFNNVERTLIDTTNGIFNLNYKEFSKEI